MPVTEFKLIIGIIVFILLVAGLVWVVQQNNPVEWWHFIATKSQNGDERGDLNKLGQVVGIATSSWAVIVEAYAGHLDAFILAAYLAFVGGVSGYSAYLRSRGPNDNVRAILPGTRESSGADSGQCKQPTGEG